MIESGTDKINNTREAKELIESSDSNDRKYANKETQQEKEHIHRRTEEEIESIESYRRNVEKLGYY